MYQVFNVKKNRWQKFDKNGKLLGTKRTEGPYLKIPQKSEESEESFQKTEESEESLQEIEGTEEIPQKTTEAEETEETEEIPQKTTESEETLQEIEEIPQIKTIHEWLVAEKMELLSDNGILKINGLTEQSKFSFAKYAELVPKLSVRNLW